MPRTELPAENAASLTEWAEQERETSPELATILEDIAANGLPDQDECVPWEQVRDDHYRQLGIDPAGWHRGVA